MGTQAEKVRSFYGAVEVAHKKYGMNREPKIVGSTGYWDKMGLAAGTYAHADSEGRVGVVVVVDIYENGKKVNTEAWSLFQRYSDNDSVYATGQGDNAGPDYHYARGLCRHSPECIQNWIDLLEKGEVEYAWKDIAGDNLHHRYVLTK